MLTFLPMRRLGLQWRYCGGLERMGSHELPLWRTLAKQDDCKLDSLDQAARMLTFLLMRRLGLQVHYCGGLERRYG
jgi:hypothetical protein